VTEVIEVTGKILYEIRDEIKKNRVEIEKNREEIVKTNQRLDGVAGDIKAIWGFMQKDMMEVRS